MKNKIPIHFVQSNKGGVNNAFHIFNDKQLNYNYQVSTVSLLKLFESIIKKNNQNSQKNFYLKASDTKKYYEILNKNKK